MEICPSAGGLEPEVKIVLGAHNVPVASTAVLGELASAFDKVQRHEVTGKPMRGRER